MEKVYDELTELSRLLSKKERSCILVVIVQARPLSDPEAGFEWSLSRLS